MKYLDPPYSSESLVFIQQQSSRQKRHCAGGRAILLLRIKRWTGRRARTRAGYPSVKPLDNGREFKENWFVCDRNLSLRHWEYSTVKVARAHKRNLLDLFFEITHRLGRARERERESSIVFFIAACFLNVSFAFWQRRVFLNVLLSSRWLGATVFYGFFNSMVMDAVKIKTVIPCHFQLQEGEKRISLNIQSSLLDQI